MNKYYVPYLKILIYRARDLRNNPTKGEKVLWEYLRKKRLLGFDFNRQKPLLFYVADFYCVPLKLAIELDGRSHRGREEYDSIRDKQLNLYGITVLRFKESDAVKKPEWVVSEISKWIYSHPTTPPGPL